MFVIISFPLMCIWFVQIFGGIIDITQIYSLYQVAKLLDLHAVLKKTKNRRGRRREGEVDEEEEGMKKRMGVDKEREGKR